MFAIANPDEVRCKCTRCNCNPLRYTMTDKRTAKRYAQNDNDRNIDKTINEQIVLTAKVNSGEADMDVDQIEEHIEYDNYSVGAPSPEQYVNTHLPLLVEESLFETEEYTSEYESEYESSDEFKQEEQNREVYRKPSTEYLASNEDTVILITFINTILEHYGEDFRLPTSILGLRKMTGYNDLTNGVSKYVACSNCHTLYNYSNNTHTSCNFKRVGSKAYCKNDLYKSSMKNAMISKCTFIYNSLTTTLKKMFTRPSFEMRATIIDPMHNLFLRTAKRMMDIWIANNLLDDKDFVEMQEEANRMVLPVGYMTLKIKIGKKFPFMKADEWKSWCLIYSLVLLKTCLRDDLLGNWIHFVDACRELTKPSITKNEIKKAHKSLEEFCVGCEDFHKPDVFTQNMHLHLHLKETIENFGPIYGFWLFSFEHYNGVLKGFETNQKSGFENTYMKRFLESSYNGDFCQAYLRNVTSPLLFSLFLKLSGRKIYNPALSPHPLIPAFFHLPAFLQSAEKSSKQTFGNEPLPLSTLPLCLKPPTTMRKSEYDCLLNFYKIEYDDDSLCSAKTTIRNCCGDSEERYAGRIKYLFLHDFTPNLMHTNLSPCHNPQHYKIPCHQPRIKQGIELYEPEFLKYDYNNILPVHRILSPIAIGSHVSGSGAAKVVVIPLPRKLYT
ncbi:hypothetical protein PHYBLDRAFT_161840 [Phycomyces blakesleeanus NRRL 1555(-)]|uniref:Uncharacterized protein n=1 Tax=Phycomyces blakesleeanus (strain ATCC 8743b / DSM 1359 / FGSC 10004 / NBRC 33097 / NRRL 1555) TaxID=763407 RepID=A0A162Q9J7_PHYB8|nr:hypothetical protein PHYBLDRAFT_161840 [Phycomyces blakesleeanus NRRL 1555(-)]OAD81216.1 hypothetical protein PHYBLDRAFT_161840 [Phycomyces blakesleeanus NRRL 1555(-)]|eukprot:XP_018299256.1 hypothetical protein PHYBLDRAFT_161840 [Phycomyces blakesleeanus NRRL 1555(-)]